MNASFVQDTSLLTARSLRALRRLPVFLFVTLVQPMIWLLLFGQLFKSVVEIPGFDAGVGSFLQFLTPGIIMMTALFGGAWAGTGYIQDMDRGVMDRLLTSPVSRGSMMISNLAYQAIFGHHSNVHHSWGRFGPGGAVFGWDRRRSGRSRRCRAPRRHLCGAIQCDRTARAPAASADRTVAAHHAAADVPELRRDGYEPCTGMGADDRPLQSRRMGDRRRAGSAAGNT